MKVKFNKVVSLDSLHNLLARQGLGMPYNEPITMEGRFFRIKPRRLTAAYRLVMQNANSHIEETLWAGKKLRPVAVMESEYRSDLYEVAFRHECVLGHAAWYRLITALFKKGAAVVIIIGERFTSQEEYRAWVMSNNLSPYIDAEERVNRQARRKGVK